jgi:hypothetical protein
MIAIASEIFLQIIHKDKLSLAQYKMSLPPLKKKKKNLFQRGNIFSQ